MQNDRFEWDDVKALGNERKHGVTFDDATRVFDDPNVLIEPEFDAQEEREISIGLARDTVPYVVSTDRWDRIRIISARKANRHEQDRYYRQAHS
jgi:uncharacterized protein